MPERSLLTRPVRVAAFDARERSPRGVPCRPFQLFDVLALVAATAVGFALARKASARILPWEWLRYSWAFTALTAALLACWGVALLVARLRRPRPAWSRLMRQPGMTACLAASLAIALRWLIHAPMLLVPTRPRLTNPYWYECIPRAPSTVGPAVVVAWVALALSGRRRPEPGWIDASGRWLGAAWIALFVEIDGWKVLASVLATARV